MTTTPAPPRGRVRLGIWPTPLQPVEPGALYVKREDLCGFAFGGSKVRALEPLLDEALGRAADTIVVGGRRDSNWVALAATAASRLGLACHCVVDPGPVEPLAIGVARRFGATIHTARQPGVDPVNAAIAGLAAELGPSAVGIARAGATATGTLGYRAMASEILDVLGRRPVDIVIALGSGGACAGLLLGLGEAAVTSADLDVLVYGVPVAKAPPQAERAVRTLLESARAQALTSVDPGDAIRRLRVLPRVGARAALADRAEASCGTVLDPVFAGPAWHTFCAQRADTARSAVLVASGGLPAFFDSLTGDVR